MSRVAGVWRELARGDRISAMPLTSSVYGKASVRVRLGTCDMILSVGCGMGLGTSVASASLSAKASPPALWRVGGSSVLVTSPERPETLGSGSPRDRPDRMG
eukprot:7165134-Pyramimonas_sp.AAC.1